LKKICIIIPCYNEENRLPVDEYLFFLQKNPSVSICFVNDGSRDKTLEIIQNIKVLHAEKVEIITYHDNEGKASAVRKGMQHRLKELSFDYFAYFDADLSAPLEECFCLADQINQDIEFCFGSRIMRVGSHIERSTKRHFVGRIVATFIDGILKLQVYDTQCGAKLFTRELSLYLFNEPFISKWLFDVELFARMIQKYGRETALQKMREIPLNKWINKDGSKVKPIYFFKLWIDLFKIRKKYF
jgi:dolichyl-phosphate beta-glucosyltransferase